jgi:hypothetical protein
MFRNEFNQFIKPEKKIKGDFKYQSEKVNELMFIFNQ